MIRISFILITLLLQGLLMHAQPMKPFNTTTLTVEVDSNHLVGTLTLPEQGGPYPLVLFLSGSGHIDRDGNQPNLTNNAYKLLAEQLVQHGIATLRYDKRGVGESEFNMDESILRFDHYIDDAVLWIKLLKKDERFSKIIIAGHSEGSLIGMVAAQREAVTAFISIAGAGRPIDEVLKMQLKTAVRDSAYYQKCSAYLDTLKQGKHLINPDSALFSLFRPSIQSYMINWIQYNPGVEIGKLKIPVLILQGEHDIQVEPGNANILAGANKKASMRMIDGMNHVLKVVEEERAANFAAYSDPSLPVAPDLVQEMVRFILK